MKILRAAEALWGDLWKLSRVNGTGPYWAGHV